MGNSFVGIKNNTKYDNTYVSFDKRLSFDLKKKLMFEAARATCDIDHKGDGRFTLMVKDDRDHKACSDMAQLVVARVGRYLTSDGFVQLRQNETSELQKWNVLDDKHRVYMYRITKVIDNSKSYGNYDVGTVKLYEMAGNDIWAPKVDKQRKIDNVTEYESGGRFKLVASLDVVDRDESWFTIRNKSDHATFVSISAAEDLGPAARLLEALEAAGDNVNAENWAQSCNELLEAIGLDFGEILRHDQDDGLYDLDSSFTEDGAILATVKTVPGGISDVATIKEEIKSEVAEHLKEHGFTELQPGQHKLSPGGALSSVQYAHIWQIRETADGKLELYTCGQKTKTYSRDDWTRYYDVTNDESALIKGFKLLGQITVEEAQHGPWKVRIERLLSAGTDNNMHYLHLSSLEVFDQSGKPLQLAYNGNASDHVKQGATPEHTPAALVDGNIRTGCHSAYRIPTGASLEGEGPVAGEHDCRGLYEIRQGSELNGWPIYECAARNLFIGFGGNEWQITSLVYLDEIMAKQGPYGYITRSTNGAVAFDNSTWSTYTVVGTGNGIPISNEDHWMEFDVPAAQVFGSGTPTTIVVGNDLRAFNRFRAANSATAGVKLAVLDHDGTPLQEFTLTDDQRQTFELDLSSA